MAETYFVRDLLLPELDTEIGKTRRLFEALPDGKSDFKPYEKSLTLGRLTGHTTDLCRFIAFTLTMSELDMAVAWQPYTMALQGQMLERFEKNASDALAAFRQSSDETFRQPWTIKRGPNILFSSDRFTYYRNQGINQIVHHRAQLGTYLRASVCQSLVCKAPLRTESNCRRCTTGSICRRRVWNRQARNETWTDVEKIRAVLKLPWPPRLLAVAPISRQLKSRA